MVESLIILLILTTIKKDKLMSESIRTCIGCGSKGQKNELVRIALSKEKKVVIDEWANTPGRGAYLHKSEICLKQAIKRNMFAKSFRHHIPILGTELFHKEFMEWITNRKS